ncbi:MAG: alpha/beta fold hydrolase, partial [Bacteroidales bacterium]|nr:alpha/beta fold hydrolase [Bacteroidales bacterium]
MTKRLNKTIAVFAALILSLLSLSAKEYKVSGPQGGLAMNITLPDNFNPKTDKCPMVILMHGIFSSKNFTPMPQIAKSLAKRGVASIRFDFGGHWASEGKMINMTIPKELQDARAMWDYASTLPYVTSISLLGHSQGGVIASMTAGLLASEGKAPKSLVLLAPGSVIK